MTRNGNTVRAPTSDSENLDHTTRVMSLVSPTISAALLVREGSNGTQIRDLRDCWLCMVVWSLDNRCLLLRLVCRQSFIASGASS